MHRNLPVLPGLRIERLLAKGGSSSVYVAADTRHDRRVAVKVLDAGLRVGQEEAFEHELRAMARLGDHPNVIDLYDSGTTETGVPYIVMPLISTGTVAQRIERREIFDLDEILDIGVKLASAIATAHRRGILHCDIKPSNVFLGQFASPMLGDLGISSIADGNGRWVGSAGLTIMYAAPEVITDASCSASSDIYSLGATLIAMVELAPPFSGGTNDELVTEITDPETTPRLTRAIPEDLRALLEMMMARNPKSRPPSAVDVIERLQAVQRSLTGTQSPASIGPDESADSVAMIYSPVDDFEMTMDHLPHTELSLEHRSRRNLVLAVTGMALAGIVALFILVPMLATESSGPAKGVSIGADDEVLRKTTDADASLTESNSDAKVVVLVENEVEEEPRTFRCDRWYVPLETESISPIDVETATTAFDYLVRRAPNHDEACERGVTLRAGSAVEIHAVSSDWRYTYDPATDDWGWVHAAAFDLAIN